MIRFQKLQQEYAITQLKTPMLIDTQLSEVYIGLGEIKKLFEYKSSILLGLLDGLNPCAVSLLLIFLNILQFNNATSVLYGLSYIFGVFSLNLFAGFGFYYLFYNIRSYFPSWFIYIILGPILFYSFLILFGVKNKRVMLWKDNLKKYIISKLISGKKGYFIFYIVGILVGLLELGCSTQIYLPYIYNLKVIQIKNLIIYNLFYISYLIIILLSFNLVGGWLEKNNTKYFGLIEKVVAIISILVIFYFMLK